MITRPTVFVLGAGASAPYGFPLGRHLQQIICRDLRRDDSQLFDLVTQCGFRDRDIEDFRIKLTAAGRWSIDAFLERRPEYLQIGKTCIAAALLPHEIAAELDELSVSDTGPEIQERRQRRWYHYLFDQMLSGDSFTANQLSVITFNFDRSFERSLYRVIEANHSGDQSVIREICKSLPIVHLHGYLGAPSWLDDSPGARGYGVSTIGAADIGACATQIQLVTDDPSEKLAKQARALLESAEVVCYLGFSFHPLNLKKLSHDELVLAPREDNVQRRGTAFGLPTGRRNAVQALFKGRIILQAPEWDILKFLQETDFIHG